MKNKGIKSREEDARAGGKISLVREPRVTTDTNLTTDNNRHYTSSSCNHKNWSIECSEKNCKMVLEQNVNAEQETVPNNFSA